MMVSNNLPRSRLIFQNRSKSSKLSLIFTKIKKKPLVIPSIPLKPPLNHLRSITKGINNTVLFQKMKFYNTYFKALRVGAPIEFLEAFFGQNHSILNRLSLISQTTYDQTGFYAKQSKLGIVRSDYRMTDVFFSTVF